MLHPLWLKGVGDERPFSSLKRAVEHEAVVSLKAASDGVRTPKTSHTLMRVPFVIHDAGFDGEYRLDPPDDAGLSHVAATALELLGFTPPSDYQPSLLTF